MIDDVVMAVSVFTSDVVDDVMVVSGVTSDVVDGVVMVVSGLSSDIVGVFGGFVSADGGLLVSVITDGTGVKSMLRKFRTRSMKKGYFRSCIIL